MPDGPPMIIGMYPPPGLPPIVSRAWVLPDEFMRLRAVEGNHACRNCWLRTHNSLEYEPPSMAPLPPRDEGGEEIDDDAMQDITPTQGQ